MAIEDLELSDGFVRACLEDNQRLRIELAAATAEVLNLNKEINETKRHHYVQIYHLVKKLGGSANVERSGDYDPRRLFIEVDGYDGTTRYRLAKPSEVDIWGDGIGLPKEEAA